MGLVSMVESVIGVDQMGMTEYEYECDGSIGGSDHHACVEKPGIYLFFVKAQ